MSEYKPRSKLHLIPDTTHKEWLNQKHPEDVNDRLKSKAINIKVPNDPYEHGKLESQIVKECNEWLRSQGYEVKTIFTGGIPIGNGALVPNPCEGVPDAMVFDYRKKELFFIEYKRTEGGILKPAQQDFHAILKSVNIKVYIITSKTMLIKVLTNETIK